MGFTVDTGLSGAAVFAQGLLSFFSPCVLPLLPLYLGYLSGGMGAEEESTAKRRGRTFLHTLFFVIGISFAIFLLGLGMSIVGSFFGGNRLLFARIGGVIVILFGLYQLGVFGAPELLSREKRLPLRLDQMAMSPWTALLMGFVFSFAWTPCVGPVLSGVLLMAASAPEVKAFLEENGYTYPVLMDDTGTLMRYYGISAIPTTFMIDAKGNVYGYVPGAMSAEIMQSIIDQTLRGEAAD